MIDVYEVKATQSSVGADIRTYYIMAPSVQQAVAEAERRFGKIFYVEYLGKGLVVEEDENEQ